MADSLRVRLLRWYAVIVVAVIVMVGAAVCLVTWRARLAKVDAELTVRAEAIASSVERGVGGAFDVELSADVTAYFQDARSRPYYAVWSDQGQLIDRSEPDLAVIGPPRPGARTSAQGREMVIARRGLTVLVGRSISDVWAELWGLAGTIAIVALAGVAASLGGAWLLAGRALAPVQRINETARRMADGDLGARIAVERTDTELGQVASALNLAFDRLRESVERQRQFTADASHELRTPVTTIMAELEWAMLRDRPAADYRESLETCHRAGARMQSLIEALLTLARADSGELAVRRVSVRLDALVEEAIELVRPVARQRGVTLRAALIPLTIAGDPDRLRELLSNLLFNGVAYNRAHGVVTVELERASATGRLERASATGGLERARATGELACDGTDVLLRVHDTGIGIDPEDLPRVFDRFYRGERAREREPAGAGLGLALVRWIVEAHGGTIDCTSERDCFTTFVVRFPHDTTEPAERQPRRSLDTTALHTETSR
jgi:signal transduction histidine kinase